MNYNTRLLLRSAEHWLDNFDRATKSQPLRINSEDCPLCEAHLENLGCGQCPIAADTGRQHCYNTPYYRVRDSYEGWSNEPLLEAVAAEYTYLISLTLRHHEEHP